MCRLLAAAMVCVSCAVGFADVGGGTVRVGLCYGETAPRSAVVRGKGRFQGGQGFGTFGGDLRVRANGGELVVGRFADETKVGNWVEMWPAGSDPWLEIGGYAYRGRLRIELQADGGLKVINLLSVEDYVRGVVPNEMFADPEGYKVQAVASRTLALYIRDRAPRHEGEGFDVCATGHCQVYRGVDSESPLSDEAVQATAGEIVTFHGKPILAAYHSNAGGATDEVDEVWPGSVKRDFTYLAVVKSPYDQSANRLPGYQWCYHWERPISLAEVGQRLAARGQRVGEVQDLIVRQRSRSNRVKDLEVVGRAGSARVVGTAAVNQVLGTPSSKLHLKKRGNSFTAEGWGYGDGIGLSQQGALGMAWAGHSYQEILGHYYRGVSLAEDYGRGKSVALAQPALKTARSR
jgi:stage II sporulation protein D